ncbi:hypothetical protein TSUD_364830 [Trifolium subterraneum]|uniref:Uncharacterized protein n=1 Tax=Trifolium subterraneum TaxID=3900 RepID=A0A2Z6MM63_TRISU|nr:hypothetical protein TSUD_364830 [Trifolium subterraneum]
MISPGELWERDQGRVLDWGKTPGKRTKALGNTLLPGAGALGMHLVLNYDGGRNGRNQKLAEESHHNGKRKAEQNVDFDDESLIESQPLRQSLWDSKVPDNFKSPHLQTFDGKTDPVEHLMAVGTQTAIIGAPEHLRCKLLSETLKDAALSWYMNLPNNSIESYADFHKKFIHQFSGTKHVKVTAISLFTIRQSYAETLREYLTRFSEATITVANPNQEMFIAAFHNGLKAGHFNESLAQKPATSMQEVVKRASCYIKGEESNAEKRSRDAKEKDSRSSNNKGSHSQSHRNWENTDTHTGVSARVHMLHEIHQAGLAPLPPPRMHNTIMGPDTNVWRAYHRCKCHDTERCFRLRDLIEELIRSGHLRKFLKDAAKGGGESNSARKRYVRKSRFEISSVGSSTFPHTPEISFNPEYVRDMLPHDDDPLVIQVQILNCDVKRVLIDSGSSPNILYWNAYKAMRLSDEQLNPYSGMLVGFAGEQVDVIGHITLYTTFGEDENAKTFKVRYLVVKTLFTSYNIIIGRPAFNALGAVMSTLYLSIKYPLNNGKVGVVKGDQVLARKCYESNLDPREEFQDRRVSPIEDLELVQIGEQSHQTTNIGTSLQPEEREKIITILRNNRDLFAWHPSDMPEIDESVITHKLSISPANKPVVQRKRKVGEERRAAITEEVAKLKEAGFIEEIKYPAWLENVVMVKKASDKWRMCVDFTDLNKAYPKDPYPLPNIDRLIDGASGYKMLSFMDAYSGYNQIKMHPMDAQHTTFMSNTCNYFYNVMPFGLKNAGATYQRLMDKVFLEQIGKNLEVYIDDMVVKTQKEGEHDQDLGDILKSVRKYNMRLNPAKCSFGVQAGKFLDFLLTHGGIEANPDKCQAIINMRSPTSVKEVQQLTGRITALSRFLSCSGEKACHFFSTLKKSERFTWSPECEEAFQKLKVLLASTPILTRPEQGKTLYLYLAVSETALILALVQEVEGEEKSVYFMSRMLRGAETRYQKIERLCLAVVITARKLRRYFQSHQVVVKIDYPIKNVLRKPDLAGRMVAWSVELSEFDITYIPRGPIKSQALADFVLEMTDPPSEGEAHPWTLSVDGSSNLRGSGAGVVLEGPDGVLIEQSLRFAFKASNNQAECEALIAGMKLAKEMEVKELKVQRDSQLVANQISGDFQTKDPQLAKYLEKVKGMVKQFTMFELTYVPREQNARADLLAKLASTKKPGNHRTVIQETLKSPSINEAELAMVVEEEDWRSPIIRYLQMDALPLARDEAAKVKKMAAWYTLVGGKLYRRSFTAPMLLCVSKTEACRILKEVHEGSCGSHIGSISLAGKVMRDGFYWPNLHDDAARHVKTCDRCQRYSNLHHAPGETLKSVLSPWPFYMWGVDIQGPFPIFTAQARWILVAVDYFTKWVEAEPISDNDTQFASERVVEYGRGKGIQNTFISVEHPQANGQAESSNKSYHTTPQSSMGEPPFTMVYGADAMIPVEIQPSTCRRDTLTLQENNAALEESLDLLLELREKAHFREFYTKQRAARKYNTRVIPRKFKEGDLVLKRSMGREKGGKMAANWEGPFRIKEAFEGGAYRLETMEGEILPRTWNIANLRFYYS